MHHLPLHRLLLATILGGALVACANTPASPPPFGQGKIIVSDDVRAALKKEQTVVANTKDSEIICRKEQPVGSHRNKTVCRTRAEIRAAQEAASDVMLQGQMRKSAAPPTESGG